MELNKAVSCDDYRNHLLDALAMRVAERRFKSYSYCGVWYDVMPSADPESDNAGEAAKDDSAGEYTTTNVQEEGVDELDTVKNDGTYMYTIRGRKIHISKIWPVDAMEEVAVIDRDELKSNNPDEHKWMYPYGLFLTDDKKLIDISQVETWSYTEDYWYSHYHGVVSVRIFDVSDPKSPKLLKSHQIEGQFEDARLIDNRLHLVSSAVPAYTWYDVYKLSIDDIPGVPRFYSPCDEDDFSFDDWSDEDWENYRKKQDEWHAKSAENMENYLPVIRAWLDKKYPDIADFNWPNYFDGKNSKPAVGCEDLYIPAMASQNDGFLMVSEFSGDDYGDFKASAIADSGWLVYASKKNLYVSSFSYNWYWSCTDDDCDKSYTHIHHFNLGNKGGDVQYVNSGEITGIADDSFNYSEYDNHLRVVSSPSRWSNSPTGHKLTVLDINGSKVMTETGSVEGFGKNERLYASRMFGDKGYVVTYRNTDPLFVFDLSDHANPKQVGELKINGYSSYIHPVGADHLLTIGEDATESGTITGMKLDLYDVSNPAKPTRKYTVKINDEEWSSTGGSYGWSEALSNHHAFQYHAGSGLLAIPVNLEKWTYTNSWYDWNYQQFSGMFVYRVTPDSDFEFLGGVDHADLVPSDDHYWWTSVSRSRFYFKTKGVYDQDAYIYTISRHGLKASNALKPDETFGVIKYEKTDDDWWY
ncbi:MAG: beta-propeller domain-containing protein [Proteobacteria bacterium]|nr:beta-propeller domain-containing protein [Pseudomonadota bacterium]